MADTAGRSGVAPAAGNQLDKALAYLEKTVVDGVKHGYFSYSISCEMVSGRKRVLVIGAGKSHKFTIREEEIPG